LAVPALDVRERDASWLPRARRGLRQGRLAAKALCRRGAARSGERSFAAAERSAALAHWAQQVWLSWLGLAREVPRAWPAVLMALRPQPAPELARAERPGMPLEARQLATRLLAAEPGALGAVPAWFRQVAELPPQALAVC